MSWRDVVEATPQTDAFPLFSRAVEKSVVRTVRVMGQDDDQLERLRSGVVGLGCSIEGAWSKLIAIDVPAAASLDAARAFLIKGGFQREHADPTYEECAQRQAQ